MSDPESCGRVSLQSRLQNYPDAPEKIVLPVSSTGGLRGQCLKSRKAVMCTKSAILSERPLLSTTNITTMENTAKAQT